MPGLTNFPNGISSFGIPIVGAGTLPPYTGNYFWVKETGTAGASAGAGTNANPFNSLAQAFGACQSGNNDVIFLEGTAHLTANLAWNKDKVHLVGVCAPLRRGKRARISVSGSTAFGPLVTVTGQGCQFQNFGTFFGFGVTGSTSPICWSDTGGRNCYNNVEFLGFGDATASTGTANQTGARALLLSGSTGESTFRDCVFGVDTTSRNATNYTVEIAGGSPRNTFQGCDFESLLGSSGTAASHVLIGASGIDRYLDFIGCRFWSAVKSTGSTMAQVFNINAAAGGFVSLDQCTAYGATHWETSASGNLVLDMGLVTAHDGGISIAASPS